MDAIDLEMHAGDSKVHAITVLSDEDEPVDLTLAEITWVLTRAPGGAALVSKTFPAEIEVPDPTTGVFNVPLEPEDTADLEPRAYYYEAEVIERDGGPSSTVLEGRFTLHASSIRTV